MALIVDKLAFEGDDINLALAIIEVRAGPGRFPKSELHDILEAAALKQFQP